MITHDSDLIVLQLFRKEHFFRGSDNTDQLLKILKVLGTDDFDKYMETYDIEMETDSDSLLRR
jgi:casein kinase II subunit alpha